MRICVLSLLLTSLTSAAFAQTSISVVGRVITGNSTPLNNIEVTLGIAAQTDLKDRIVSDRSNSSGLFHLAKSNVGNFSELYLWIEEPYSYKPTPVMAVKTDMWRKKIDDIVVKRTLVGAIPLQEASERISAIYAIEQKKAELGWQDLPASKLQAQKLSKNVLAKCDNIQQPGKLKSIVENAEKMLNADKTLLADSRSALLDLPNQNDFKQLVAAERIHKVQVTNFLTAYLKGEQPFDDKIAVYVDGLDPSAIQPEWFAQDDAANRVWVNLRPRAGKGPEDLYFFSTVKTEEVDGHDRWTVFPLHVNAREPPKTEDVEKWFKANPNNAKTLFKAILLADPNVSDEKKEKINMSIRATDPIVTPRG